MIIEDIAQLHRQEALIQQIIFLKDTYTDFLRLLKIQIMIKKKINESSATICGRKYAQKTLSSSYKIKNSHSIKTQKLP